MSHAREHTSKRLPWSRLPPDILEWTQEKVFVEGQAQNWGGNYTFYEDEVDSVVDWLIPNVRDKVFFDVGARIGIWAVIAALCGAREIHLFEYAQHLPEAEENVRRTGFTNVFAVKKRITDKVWDRTEVESLDTLDHYGFAPGFIKIDVEGQEMEVLRGAQETIKRYHPMLMIENHASQDRDQEILELAGEGYKMDPPKDLGNHRHVFLRWINHDELK